MPRRLNADYLCKQVRAWTYVQGYRKTFGRFSSASGNLLGHQKSRLPVVVDLQCPRESAQEALYWRRVASLSCSVFISKYCQPWVLLSCPGLLYQRLRDSHRAFCLPIWLWKFWTGRFAIKPPHFGELFEPFWLELGSVVCYTFGRYSTASKVSIQAANHRCCSKLL